MAGKVMGVCTIMGTLGMLSKTTLNIPNDRKISNSERVLPFVFVGDDAFGLKRHMMKPYPFTRLGVEKRSFNYHLSRVRRVIENTFGIMAARFRLFHRLIHGDVEKVIANKSSCYDA